MTPQRNTCRDCRPTKACWDCLQLVSYLDVARKHFADKRLADAELLKVS